MTSNEGDVLFHLNPISESSQLLLLVSQTSAKNLNCIVMRIAMVPLCSMHHLCTIVTSIQASSSSPLRNLTVASLQWRSFSHVKLPPPYSIFRCLPGWVNFLNISLLFFNLSLMTLVYKLFLPLWLCPAHCIASATLSVLVAVRNWIQSVKRPL